ncbi:MAG: NAD+ synthase [Pseudanabaenaceae cyanobacterium SKYGB_i_bin29]|nr:NAD+ synthase [Pseudanabaenaceae cyanobacterium SKYG29]MDW8421195.1 NAD+ synthase [Pseudanabaenaceae cyanobacterium SKYGB_i_bin29]
MRIALAQINPIVGDLEGNTRKILALAKDVDVLITSELALCGYPPRDLLLDRSFIHATQQSLAELAQSLPPHITVLVGAPTFATTGVGQPLWNSAVCLQGGKISQVFPKRLLPNYDVFDEQRYFRSGTTANVLSLQVGEKKIKIGVTICEDLWHDVDFLDPLYDQNPLAELVRQPIDLLVNLSASPFTMQKQRLREKILQHHAQKYELPIVYVNQVGGNDDLIFDGNSFVVNRQGEVVARAKSFQPDLLLVEFDTNKGDFPLPVTPGYGVATEAEVWQALVLGLRDYAYKCGFQRAVLGLSGGIDSALVATIATEALGRENVLGVLMPSPYSSSHSIADAQQLADNLGIKTVVIPITPLMQSYDQALAPLFQDKPPDVTEENLQSRIRGTLLMALSNKFGYLLLSTGNKSELAVGYCTLYGDMNGGLAVIGDVPKTLVYRLCHWLNAAPDFPLQHLTPGVLIPPAILTKAPSAELRPNQTDQDSLPPYDILDDILFHLIDRHASRPEIVARGHDPATVDRVIHLVRRAEFKRRQAAPTLKISDRAFGTGWRMPIASKFR